MAFLKKTGLFLLAQLFGFSIFCLAIVFSLNGVFSKPNKLKHALNESGIYSSVADKIKTEALLQFSKDSFVQANQNDVKDALDKVVTPDLLRQNGDKIVDGTYKWLDGTTKTPEFNIDVAGVQKQVTDIIAESAFDHVQTLPSCNGTQLEQLRLNGYSSSDPFSYACNIPGISKEQLKDNYAKSIKSEEGVTAKDNFNAKDVKNDQGQNAFSEMENVTKVYRLMQVLPLVLGVLAVLSSIGLYFWSETRAKGLKKISFKLLFSGVSLLLIFIVSIVLFEKVLKYLPVDVVDLKNSITRLLKILSKEFNKPLLFFAANFVVFGLAGLIIPKINKPNQISTNTKESNPSQTKAPISAEVTSSIDTVAVAHVPSAPRIKSKPPRLVQ